MSVHRTQIGEREVDGRAAAGLEPAMGLVERVGAPACLAPVDYRGGVASVLRVLRNINPSDTDEAVGEYSLADTSAIPSGHQRGKVSRGAAGFAVVEPGGAAAEWSRSGIQQRFDVPRGRTRRHETFSPERAGLPYTREREGARRIHASANSSVRACRQPAQTQTQHPRRQIANLPLARQHRETAREEAATKPCPERDRFHRSWQRARTNP